jgi:hypothetical protein
MANLTVDLLVLCVVCAMRETLEDFENDAPKSRLLPPGAFRETPEAHIARCHPDLAAAKRERAELERRLAPYIAREDARKDMAPFN